ncbi:hypothetical protein NliqN6_2862 [Naganishia liquefaciens]|uniref:DNA-(apurinic or apyrimidinic site) lyase n=1 Tax=Naganishia liquefaciens TaxID=104408 RepID=A0A8H3TTN0_9TREE|nr:hypothetical protein NliqN6_2862 [Naganishia liquefaciens]
MSTATTGADERPRFPEQWHALEIPVDELDLRHTLPVGQTFLWHRQGIQRGWMAERVGDTVEGESRTFVKQEPGPPVKQEPETPIKQEPTDPSPLVNPEPSFDTPPSLPTDEWSRAIPNPPRILFLRQTPSRIYYTSLPPHPATDRAYLVDLFNVHVTAEYGSLNGVYDAWAHGDPALFGKTRERGGVPTGVRVLRQDPWECLLSFITSSANNVPRITSLMHRLCRHFSPPLITLPAPSADPSATPDTDVISTTTYHLFPRPIDLLSQSRSAAASGTGTGTGTATATTTHHLEHTLRDLGFGYRAGFIAAAVRTLVCAHGTHEERALLGEESEETEDTTEGETTGEVRDVRGVEAFLHGLRTEGAPWREELLALKGVGRKVADCIGLMSLDRHHIVPIDTHLQQIAARHPRFPAKLKSKATSTEAVYNAVQEFLAGIWGSDDHASGLAGWCQSVMFAADLKGSTAVVGVKVEQTVMVKEEVLLVGGGGGGGGPEESDRSEEINGRRSRQRRQVKSSASVVSEEMLDVPPAVATTTTTRKRKRHVEPLESGARKSTSKAGGKVARKMTTVTTTTTTRISDLLGSEKGSLQQGERIKGEADAGDGTARKASRRAERYAVRCDKLEVDPLGPTDSGGT